MALDYDWFEENAPEPSQTAYDDFNEYNPDKPHGDDPLSGVELPYNDGYGTSTQQAQGPTNDNGGFPTGNTDTPDNGGSNPNIPSGNEYPGSDHDRQGPGGEQEAANRAIRERQAAELNARLGINGGNLESFLSGRNTWEGYLADQNARATNYTGNRLLDSQGGNYNNDSTLTAQGIAALRAAGLNPNGTRITPTGTGGNVGGDYRDYGMVGGSGFGAAPAPFGETYSTLERPDYLKGEYKPPVWGEVFKAPTGEEVESEPGYAFGLQQGQKALERSAAARGSVLSGGTQKATARYGVDYGATKYGEATGRLFDQYQQRYGQFQDAANLAQQARGVNENAYQTDSGNNLSQYVTRFNAYQTAIGNQRNADNDVWSRTQDQIRNSLTAAGLARP